MNPTLVELGHRRMSRGSRFAGRRVHLCLLLLLGRVCKCKLWISLSTHVVALILETQASWLPSYLLYHQAVPRDGVQGEIKPVLPCSEERLQMPA